MLAPLVPQRQVPQQGLLLLEAVHLQLTLVLILHRLDYFHQLPVLPLVVDLMRALRPAREVF